MRFLLVCTSLAGGGAERVAVNLAKSFVALGHSVTLFQRNRTQDYYHLDSRVARIYPRYPGVIGQVVSLSHVIDDFSPDALISFTDASNVISYLASRLSRRTVAYIPTVHTDVKARDERIGLSIKFKIIRVFHRFACKRAYRVVAVSKGAKAALINYYGVAEHKVNTIWNPVLEKDFVILGRNNVKHNPSTVRLVAVGRLTEAKNYFLMLDVVKELNFRGGSNYLLDIYGYGELEEKLKAYTVENGLEDVVSFNGFVENIQLVINEYDAFVLTSSWEGFGNVLVEALCASLPVVARDCPSGPREILSEGKFGHLVSSDDVVDFCLAIESAVRQSMDFTIDDVRDHLNNFRVDVVAERYIGLVSNDHKIKA